MAAINHRALAHGEGVVTRLGRAVGPGRLTKRGDQWVLDYRAGDGRRVRECLSRDKRVAERIRAQRIAQRDMEMAGLGAVEGQSRLLAEIRDAFLADLKTRSTVRYHEYAGTRIDFVLREINARRVCDVRPHEILQVRARMLASGLSPTTANHKIDTVRGMLTWAVKVGLIAENPIRTLPRLLQPESQRVHRRRAMTEEEISRFLKVAREDDRRCVEQLAPRDAPTKSVQWSLRRRGLRVPQAPLWRALVETGCRWGELTRATWCDLDLDRGVLQLRAEYTKTKRSRAIPLLEGLAAELRELRDTQALVLRRPVRPDDRIFKTPEGCDWPWATNGAMRVFDRVLEAAGIDRLDGQGRKLDIHALRHTAGSRLLRNGVPLQKVQHVLGHADSRMTSRIYAHLEVEDLREAVRSIEGFGTPSANRRDAC